jgi:hypothetical protein
VKQEMFEINSKIFLIRLLVHYRGNLLRFALEDCIRDEELNKMHVPTFVKLCMYV